MTSITPPGAWGTCGPGPRDTPFPRGSSRRARNGASRGRRGRCRLVAVGQEPDCPRNACWALGHLCAEDAVPPLQDRARSDGNADVRTRASWALAEING
ncbi:HEAT repeat domain-containing protein [Halorubrum persicum]|uniref:HEAT repeat domain-containing protein n=1 Tax=Halorubrum persicum TaxID=1383844 RepID=UPI0015D4EFBA